MSAGPFTFTNYQANDASLHTVRVQPETLAMNGALPSSMLPADPPVKPRAIVSKGRREPGVLHCRLIRIQSPTPPAGYKPGSAISLPILASAAYNVLPEIGQNLGVAYLGVSSWVIVGKSPELWTS